MPLAVWCFKNALASLGVRPHENLHAEMQACAPLLEGYAWPGNVRELRSVMERAALFLAAEPLQAPTPAFMLGVAPELASAASSLDDAPPIPPVVAAAKYLGISRTTLWGKIGAGE